MPAWQNARWGTPDDSVVALFEFDDVGPSGGVVGAFEVVADGIGEAGGFAGSIFWAELLGADDDGLAAVDFVQFVESLVNTSHLLAVFGIEVKQVGLYALAAFHAHHYHSGAFILESRAVFFFQGLHGAFHYV